MIVVVTPNPAVDVTYRVARHEPGETNRVLDVQRRPGGKGLNVAHVLAGLGVAVTAVLPLGGEAGRWVAGQLQVPHDVSALHGETRTTVTVVGEGHPTVFTEPGPETSEAEWARFGALLDRHLAGADLLVVSGSLPRGAAPELLGEWVRAAHRAGVRVLADVSGPALLAAAKAGADVVKPNLGELLDATSTVDERAGAEQLARLGAGIVVVSRGAEGIAAHTASEVVEVPAVPGVSGNPTGAGDAATAGLAAALVAGLPLVQGLRRAAALGAAAVLRPVAGEVDFGAYRRFLDSNGEPA
ncbi:hexose kinase [Amycolatopsis rhabdoformis]|uniref:Hexose kinase n=1 Tax=Amycolatopsis rhabdoformis TaxID=1448059 RepID=A0ABZ1IAY5_9PSEU|nr:hexose kinase [Amycolatopsis rhabdoformis]WSE31179.1 hexose kinase [Amycolatopsis rhabdoformis]